MRAIRRWSRVTSGSMPVSRASRLDSRAPPATAAPRQARCAAARRPASLVDQRQQLAQRQVLAAQDVALADPPALQRQHMALRHVVDVHDVQPGIDIGRHPPGGGVADHPAGRRRLDVARADRGGRVDDHRRQPFARAPARSTACSAGISSACRCRRSPPRSTGVSSSAGVPSPVRPRAATLLQCTIALHPGRRGGAHQRRGAVDVGAQHRRGVRHPDPVVGGDMHDIAAAGDRARRGAAGRSRSPSTSSASSPARLRRSLPARTSRRSWCPRRQQRARHRRSDEAGGAGHQGEVAVHAAGCIARGGAADQEPVTDRSRATRSALPGRRRRPYPRRVRSPTTLPRG